MNTDARRLKTHCARLDHGGCGLLAEVRDNRIVQLKGDPDGFLNRGYICPKGRASMQRLDHPERLRQPLQRSGPRGAGRWRQISWEQALATITERLQAVKSEHGARSVAFCQGMPKGLEHFLLIRLANAFGSPNVVATQDVCHAAREISGLHTCGFYPVADFHHPSALVVLWGSNITSTNEEGQICSLCLRQVQNGAATIVVDPRRTDLAASARHWLALRPGSDHLMALAWLHVIITEERYDRAFVEGWSHGFEDLARHVAPFTPEAAAAVTRVPAEEIRAAARLYAASRPAAIQWGNPIEQNVHAFDTARALVCLMAVCGNLDVPGGNVQAVEPDVLRPGKFVRADLLPDKPRSMLGAHHGTIPRLMTVPAAYFKRAVLQGDPYPVKAAYMQCTNPLLAWGDSQETLAALQRLDFLAVADICLSPTAALADIVLPAATHFEFNDIGHYGLGHGVLLARPGIVTPPEACRPDMQIINELGKRLAPAADWPENWEIFLDRLLAPAGLDFAAFAQRGFLKGAEAFGKYREAGFRTPSGKVELVLSTADRLGVSPLPSGTGLPEAPDVDYPLILSGFKDKYYLHSSYRWMPALRRRRPEPLVELHPQTAAAYGIRDGERVVIETRRGRIVQRARLTEEILPEVVCVAYGWWFPEAGAAARFDWERANANMLTSTSRLGREFGTPNLKALNCRIRPLMADAGASP